jgi:diaminohydroxyphosphoribosylaminopyrimidine deaminase/5-amino-6-(5-phosphoribosylamino)uracil reductase
MPVDAALVKTAKDIPTWVLAGADADADKRAALEAQGVQIIPSELDVSGEIDLKKAMAVLAERKIDGILLEGGGTLMGSMLKARLINKVHAFVAPKIVGGVGAPSPVGGVGVDKMSQAVQLDGVAVASYDRDLCIIGYPAYTE